MEKENDFEIQVLTRLAVIESKLDDYKKIEDTTYRAYNNSKENTKDINNLKEVEGIKEQPRQRWFNLGGTILSVVVTAIVTFILVKVGIN